MTFSLKNKSHYKESSSGVDTDIGQSVVCTLSHGESKDRSVINIKIHILIFGLNYNLLLSN